MGCLSMVVGSWGQGRDVGYFVGCGRGDCVQSGPVIQSDRL